MGKDRRDHHTADLFAHERLFPVETPRELVNALDFNVRMASAMSRALREAAERGVDRFAVAGRMSEILGTEVTKGMVDAYTSPARESHNISAIRLKAFVRATGCLWVWNVYHEGDGLTLLQGHEAVFAQAALARTQSQALMEEARRLERAAPIEIVRRGRR